ncbi:MAG: hypothetical protein R3C68_16980 [Myxococcota bacterium]
MTPLLAVSLFWGANAPKVTRPILCVELAMHSDGNPLEIKEILRALRARIPRRSLRLQPCSHFTAVETVWRVTIIPLQGHAITMKLVGPALDTQRQLNRGTLNPQELHQIIALTIAEAVRPSVDAELLARGLAQSPQSDEISLSEALAQLDEEPAASTKDAPSETSPPNKETAPQFAARLATGARAGLHRSWVSPSLELASLGILKDAVAGIALRWQRLPSTTRNETRIKYHDLELGLLAGWRSPSQLIELGGGLQGRLSLIRLDGSQVPPDKKRQSLWAVGALLSISIWPVRTQYFEIGVQTQVLGWPRAHRLLVLGERAFVQPRLEIFVAPVVLFRL